MPTEEHLIHGADFTFRSLPNGKDSLILEVAGRPRLRCGRVRCAEFSELGALSRKFRLHGSIDNLTASFETLSVIPFGCEYEVERDLEAVDGFATATVDIRAVNHGKVGNLALEDLEFDGPWNKLEFLVWGEEQFRTVEPAADEQEFHHSPETLVMIRLTADDGVRVEFATGSDLWRHRSGFRTPGASGEFVLSGSRDKIVFRRQILTYEAEAEIEKRPWRFQTVFAWSVPGREADSEAGVRSINLASASIAESGRRIGCGGKVQPELCLASAPARKFFRTQVRQASSPLRFEHANFGLCMSAAHLERPNKKELEHLDLEDWIAFYVWGNRQLLKNGHWLTMHCDCGQFADSVSAANLARRPRPLPDSE